MSTTNKAVREIVAKCYGYLRYKMILKYEKYSIKLHNHNNNCDIYFINSYLFISDTFFFFFFFFFFFITEEAGDVGEEEKEKMEKKRKNVLNELIYTEKTYVDHLLQMVALFLRFKAIRLLLL